MSGTLVFYVVSALIIALVLCLAIVGFARRQEKQTAPQGEGSGEATPGSIAARKRKIGLSIGAATALLVGIAAALGSNDRETHEPSPVETSSQQ